MAFRGMPSNFAERSWQKVTPPADLMALRPSVPSDAVPERIAPMELAPLSFASETRNASIGLWNSLAGLGFSRQDVLRNHHRPVGWNYINVIGFDCGIALYLMYRHARAIGEQFRENADLIRIEVLNNRKCHARVGRQCACRSSMNASRPPAEAPIPTIVTPSVRSQGSRSSGSGVGVAGSSVATLMSPPGKKGRAALIIDSASILSAEAHLS